MLRARLYILRNEENEKAKKHHISSGFDAWLHLILLSRMSIAAYNVMVLECNPKAMYICVCICTYIEGKSCIYN